MSKVYILTSGEYSDYKIECVTLEKEKAEKLVKIHPDWIIEAHYTDDVQILDSYEYRVKLFDNGRCDVCEVPSFWKGCNELNKVKRFLIGVNHNSREVIVQARDSEHAKKIAYDLFAAAKYEEVLL